MDQGAARRREESRYARAGRMVVSVLIGLILAVGALMLAGRVVVEQAREEHLAETGTETPVEETVSPVPLRTVVDGEGREVQIPESPQRMAILDPFAGEYAIMIGAGPQVCGIPNGVRSDLILQQIYPQMSQATFATSGSSVNIETLVDAGCDLAIIKGSLDQAERVKLTRMGIPFLVLDYQTLDAQFATFRLLGEVCGGQAQERSADLVAAYETVLHQVTERVGAIPHAEKRRVYHSINDVLLTDASGSVGSEWIERAGCLCWEGGLVSSGTDATASVESVYQYDPDLIICSAYTATDAFLSDPVWQALPAVQRGDVKTLPVGAARWGQRGDVETVFAILWLAKECYPDATADLDMRAIVGQVYGECLGVEVDDELYERILSGQGIREVGSGNGSGQ